MTRVDYNLIAAAITEAADIPVNHDNQLLLFGIKRAAHKLADAFATKNPRFDRTRFLKACGF